MDLCVCLGLVFGIYAGVTCFLCGNSLSKHNSRRDWQQLLCGLMVYSYFSCRWANRALGLAGLAHREQEIKMDLLNLRESEHWACMAGPVGIGGSGCTPRDRVLNDFATQREEFAAAKKGSGGDRGLCGTPHPFSRRRLGAGA